MYINHIESNLFVYMSYKYRWFHIHCANRSKGFPNNITMHTQTKMPNHTPTTLPKCLSTYTWLQLASFNHIYGTRSRRSLHGLWLDKVCITTWAINTPLLCTLTSFDLPPLAHIAFVAQLQGHWFASPQINLGFTSLANRPKIIPKGLNQSFL